MHSALYVGCASMFVSFPMLFHSSEGEIVKGVGYIDVFKAKGENDSHVYNINSSVGKGLTKR